jgi:predicted ATPase
MADDGSQGAGRMIGVTRHLGEIGSILASGVRRRADLAAACLVLLITAVVFTAVVIVRGDAAPALVFALVAVGTLVAIIVLSRVAARSSGTVGPAQPAAAGAVDPPPLNYALEINSFVGREPELEDLRQRIESRRLVTIQGPPGIGKTRLAMHLGRQILPRFRDGVSLVRLSGRPPGADVAEAVASTLGLGEGREEPLRATLTDQHMLLILDSCEHLVGKCADLAADLLAACPGITILTTSLVPLGLPGEHRYPLEPLRPDDAVRLFRERAGEVDPSLHIDQRYASLVRRLCQRLDNLPLAIELAAGRTQSLSLDDIEHQLDHLFQLLSREDPRLPPRQRELRAALDWSYGLLDDYHKQAFRLLAPFVGFRLDAAAVALGRPTEKIAVSDVLTVLMNHALLRKDARQDGGYRFAFLSTIRAYANEHLEASGGAAATRQLHARFYCELSESLGDRLIGRSMVASLRLLDEDETNLRLALDWAQGHDRELFCRLSGALYLFWASRGRLTEGLDRLQSAIRMEVGSERTRLKVLVGAGDLAWRGGDYARSRAWYEQALALSARSGDAVLRAYALNGMGLTYRFQGDSAQALACFKNALVLAESSQDSWGIANAYNNLGNLAVVRDEFPKAVRHYKKALRLWSETGDAKSIGHMHMSLGYIALEHRDLKLATSRLLAALDALAPTQDKLGLATLFLCCAGLAQTINRPDACVRLTGAAEALFVRAGASRLARFPPGIYPRFIEHGQLATANADRLLAEGRAMTLTEAVDCAAQVLKRPRATTPQHVRAR